MWTEGVEQGLRIRSMIFIDRTHVQKKKQIWISDPDPNVLKILLLFYDDFLQEIVAFFTF